MRTEAMNLIEVCSEADSWPDSSRLGGMFKVTPDGRLDLFDLHKCLSL